LRPHAGLLRADRQPDRRRGQVHRHGRLRASEEDHLGQREGDAPSRADAAGEGSPRRRGGPPDHRRGDGHGHLEAPQVRAAQAADPAGHAGGRGRHDRPDGARTRVSRFLEPFLREYDVEMDATRRMLERVPEARLEWKPHAKSKSLGELATHLTELPRWGERLREDTFVVGSEQAPPMKTSREFLSRYDSNVATSRAAIAAMSDDDLKSEFT